MQSKDPQAVALGKKRWANKTPEEKHAHAMKMVKAKKLKVKHDLGERKYHAVTPEQEAEEQLNQEQKYGEYPLVQQGDE